MKELLLTILRNKETPVAKYREAAHKLGSLLAYESANFLEKGNITIETQLAKTEGFKFKNNIVLIPILRSGIALLDAFIRVFDSANVGFIGLRRDEKTAIASLYYDKLPKISPADDIILLDPMIATGGSGTEAIAILKKLGLKEEKMLFVAIIASKEGIEKIKNKFPKVRIIVPHIDNSLNSKKFIVPGLGDFGDRYFGTEG